MRAWTRGATSPALRLLAGATPIILWLLPLALAGIRTERPNPEPAERLDLPRRAQPGGPSRLGPGESVVVREGRDLTLEVRVAPGDTYASLGRTYLIDLRELRIVRSLNGESLPGVGGLLRIPYASLNDDYKVRTIRDLFPEDAPQEGGWLHRVGLGRIPAAEESLWQLAVWFTGRGENFEILADRNDIPGLSPKRGETIRIPGEILLPPFARLAGLGTAARAASGTPAPGDVESPEDAPDGFTRADAGGDDDASSGPPLERGAVPPAEGAEELAYDSDGEGRFAIYELKRGEALYSAVVVRYTGRLDAPDVNELARKIARRSDIEDVTDIPIGFRVKIPLEDLLPEYLPRDDPRRLAWERGRADVARYTNRARSANLEGVAVILDAGHGGRDRGASSNGVWEHDYVYDILCRIKAQLEESTGARVLTTIKDRKEGCRIHESDRLPRSKAEFLLTTPPYDLRQRAPGVNLRWYLANAYYRRLTSDGFDAEKIVFTSLHADARHPSIGGAMIYVPGEEYRRGRYGHRGAVYTRRREVREKQYVSFTKAQRARSEGLSRQFASTLVKSFRHRGVAVHPYGPVRERIIRRGRAFVPAVLRCNMVPVEVLIEINNLNNPADSRLLRDPAYRQKVAAAYVDALHRYYGEDPSVKRPPRARS